jgi:hypothetical protein
VRFALVFAFAACGRIDFDPVERVVCPATYQTVAGSASVYRLLPNSSTWVAGEGACQADGAHLVVFDDSQEETAVLPLLPIGGGGANVSGDEAWVGISDRDVENVFVTVHGEPAEFLPWDVGEPNDFNGVEDCVHVFPGGGSYNDTTCDDVLRVLCECTPN